MFNYRYVFKQANQQLLSDLQTYSNPNYNPITTILKETIRQVQNDEITPQCILPRVIGRVIGIKKNDRLKQILPKQQSDPCLGGYPQESLFDQLKHNFQEALQAANPPNAIQLYHEVLLLEKQLFDLLYAGFAPVSPTEDISSISPTETLPTETLPIVQEPQDQDLIAIVNQLMIKIAIIDPVIKLAIADPDLYMQVKNRVENLVPIAQDFDSLIRRISSEIKDEYETYLMTGEVPGEPIDLPVSEQMYGEIPSIEKEEIEETTELNFTEVMALGVLTDFTEIMDKIDKQSLSYSIERSINNKLTDSFLDKDLREKLLAQVTYGIKRNLKELITLLERGYIDPRQSGRAGREDKRMVNRYSMIINKLVPYVLGNENENQTFEQILVEHPELLGDIVSEQHNIERSTRTEVLQNDLGTEEWTPEEGRIVDLVLPADLKDFFESHGIKELEDIYNVRELTSQFFNQQVVDDIIENPDDYQTRRTLKKALLTQPPDIQKAAKINNAAINYSTYQMNAHNFQIISILRLVRDAIVPGRRDRSIGGRRKQVSKETLGDENVQFFLLDQHAKLKDIFRICFPQELVESARSAILPDDKILTQSGTIYKHANDTTPWLFSEMLDYDQSIENIATLLLNPNAHKTGGKILNWWESKKDVYDKNYSYRPPYFPWAGSRAGLGKLLASAYGGVYKVGKRPRTTDYYADVFSLYKKNNKDYFTNFPIFFGSLTDNAAPFFGKDEEVATKMQDVCTTVGNKVEKIIKKKDKKINDQSAFYLGYMNSSILYSITRRLSLAADKKEPMQKTFGDLLQEWRNYYNNIQQDQKTVHGLRSASHQYRYYYPLRFLFK